MWINNSLIWLYDPQVVLTHSLRNTNLNNKDRSSGSDIFMWADSNPYFPLITMKISGGNKKDYLRTLKNNQLRKKGVKSKRTGCFPFFIFVFCFILCPNCGPQHISSGCMRGKTSIESPFLQSETSAREPLGAREWGEILRAERAIEEDPLILLWTCRYLWLMVFCG